MTRSGQWIIRLALLAAVAAGAVWLWGILFPSPESIIRKRLSALAEAASLSGDAPIARLAQAQKLSNHFTQDIEVLLDIAGHGEVHLNGRDDIIQAAAAASGVSGPLQVAFTDVEVAVDPDQTNAITRLTAKATSSREKEPIVEELKFSWILKDGHWLIRKIETVKTLL